MPDALQWAAFVASHPPVGKRYLQDEEGDADAEAHGGATLGMQSQTVAKVEEATYNGLGDVVGEAHLAIRYKPALQTCGACPI